MKKPEAIKVGQVWRYKNRAYKYDFVIDSIDIGRAYGKIISTFDSFNRPIGMGREFDKKSILIDTQFSFVSNKIKPRLYKTPLVICRCCGAKYDWLSGTSKKNYVCLPFGS